MRMMLRKESTKYMYKPAFTLVELIFSIVIIALVFTVVPKLLFVTSKTMEVSIKEDGLFAAMSMLGDIVRLPWDENTIVSGGKILDTGANTCTNRRIGGFIGSRNCLNSNDTATPVASFGGVEPFGDIDDYHGYSSTTTNGRVDYTLDVDVAYTDRAFLTSATTDEVKEVTVSVTSTGKTNLCSSFFYHSANLGHIQINKRAW